MEDWEEGWVEGGRKRGEVALNGRVTRGEPAPRVPYGVIKKVLGAVMIVMIAQLVGPNGRDY